MNDAYSVAGYASTLVLAALALSAFYELHGLRGRLDSVDTKLSEMRSLVKDLQPRESLEISGSIANLPDNLKYLVRDEQGHFVERDTPPVPNFAGGWAVHGVKHVPQCDH